LIKLHAIDKVEKQKKPCVWPCHMTCVIQLSNLQCIYCVILVILNIGMHSTYVKKYYVVMCFHTFEKGASVDG